MRCPFEFHRWIRLTQRLTAANTPSPSNPLRLFSSSPVSNAAAASKRRRGHDPYALAQARARKAANISRQESLQKERAAAIGNPVHGVTTPYLESFDTATDVPAGSAKGATATSEKPLEGPALNHFIEAEEVQSSLKRSFDLSLPPASTDPQQPGKLSPAEAHQQAHARASIAIQRIINLANGSSKDRTRVNIQRVIEKFGRHNTDKTLPPKPRSLDNLDDAPVEKLRAGPDTGSSEVQIGILTAKIRTLAKALETDGKKDKTNKRNLRLLVHRRQKLLKYLRRKERGGPRWQHLIETLGLTEATWKGEISL